MVSFEWGVVLVAGAIVATLAAFYAVELGRDGQARTVEPVRAEVKAATVAAARPQPETELRPKPAPRSTFAFAAARGDSWLQVRSGSFDAPVLYEGTLALGETVRLRSRRLWIRFGSAAHLDLAIDGRVESLPAFGTFDAFAGPRGVRHDPTVYERPSK